MVLSETINKMQLKDMDGTLLTLNILNEVKAEDVGVVKDAIEYAAYLHRKATRLNRGVMPRDHYITHPLRNAVRLMRWGYLDRDLLVGAILHDTVEDCYAEILSLAGVVPEKDAPEAQLIEAALDVVGDLFGVSVRRIVAGVTNPSMAAGLSESQKHEIYRGHVREAIEGDSDVLLVKLVDYLDNAGSLHHHASANLARVQRLAGKYSPLTEDFSREVKKLSSLSGETLNQVLDQLSKLSERLNVIKIIH